jgi:hypothetical protein
VPAAVVGGVLWKRFCWHIFGRYFYACSRAYPVQSMVLSYWCIIDILNNVTLDVTLNFTLGVTLNFTLDVTLNFTLAGVLGGTVDHARHGRSACVP